MYPKRTGGKMTIDNYTKVMLTVIAIATSILAFKGIGIIPTANAQTDKVMRVNICDPVNETVCARVGGLEGKGSGAVVLLVHDVR